MEFERPSVLMVGDCDHHEFSDVVSWLTAHTRFAKASSVELALQQHAVSPDLVSPDLVSPDHWHTVVLAQSRPGQIKSTDVERISQAMPLANLIALLGSWCEGETRSGDPWPGVVRVYWHQWLSRCPRELLDCAQLTTWQLPRTASAVEQSTHAVARSSPAGSGLVAIHTRRASFFHSLAKACQTGGYAAVWSQATSPWNMAGATAVLWDGQTSHDQDFQQLADVASGMSPIPVIALLGFPRHNDHTQASRCGAAAVLPCPFALPDLWELLQQVSKGGATPQMSVGRL